MNNKNKVLVGCLALLLVLSVGYALFSETVTINGTATAKGNFNITTTCTKGIAEETNLVMSDVDGLADWTEGGYENDTCGVVDNKVSFDVSLKYPGAKRFFTIKAENTGTIPASLDWNNSEDGDGLFNTNINVCKVNDDGSEGTCSSSFEGANPFRVAIMGFADKDGFYHLDPNADEFPEKLYEFFDMETGNPVLQPGQSIYYLMGLVWHDNYTSDTNSANHKFSVTTEIPFTQVTTN